MTGSTKVFTAQVGAKQVNVTLIGETLYADAYNGAAYFSKKAGQGYKVSCRFSHDGIVYESDGYAKTQHKVLDLFFSEMRVVAEQIEAAQIESELPPADLFQDDQTREEYELNNHEADKANW
jgi:hypothetical protein